MTADPNPSPSLGDRLFDALNRPLARPHPKSWVPKEGLRLLSPTHVAIAAAISGIAGTGIVAVLNAEAQSIENDEYRLSFALLFIVLLLLYRAAQTKLLESASRAIEDTLCKIRVRTATKVSRLDLLSFESLSREDVISALSRHYSTISECVIPVIAGLQSAILLVLTLIYLTTLSWGASFLSILVSGLAVQAYLSRKKDMDSAMQATSSAETALIGSVHELSDGFKELRLDGVKRRLILDEVETSASTVADQHKRSAGITTDLIVFSSAISYLFGAAVVFVLPVLGLGNHADIARLTTIVLFMLGPLSGVVIAAQQLALLQFAAGQLRSFEERVDGLGEADVDVGSPPVFQSLCIEGLTFARRSAPDSVDFSVGPINLSISPGEIVFITGGNGSGKTTALRLITGLYPAEDGRKLLNGESVATGNSAAYRSMFGTVFADFHAFRKPYGLSDAQLATLEQALNDLGIADKLPADRAAGFAPEALSTGQRKRLALALALAEERPILILDEWAADQDPHFREIFYRQILPRLKAQGKAVLAVTHDERYFDAADCRYHMEDGRMMLVTP